MFENKHSIPLKIKKSSCCIKKFNFILKNQKNNICFSAKRT